MADENGTLSTSQGLADVAADEDRLFRDGYVKGIAEFIKGCATPMTIAIQGDWGAGKTSLINLIDMELRAKPESPQDYDPDVWRYCSDIIGVAIVDVWQQSIANPKADLLEVILGEIVRKLGGADPSEMEKVSNFALATAQLLSTATDDEGNNAKGAKDASPFSILIATLFGGEEEKKDKSNGNYITVEDIETFHSNLDEALREAADENDKSKNSRFVVFIDGLDHINTEVAVDVMEHIKAFMDCPRCVFVYAIDEKTVYDGIRKKLGDKTDERRKKLFFDKIIQVPLRIPTSAYNLERYVEDLMGGDKEHSSECAEVLRILLSNPTPLSIKRYINTMYLYKNSFGGSESAQVDSLAMLLAAVILEVENEQGFNAVAKCARGDEAQLAENLKAALGSLDLNDGINRAKLPALWGETEGAAGDAAKRKAFLSWVRKLK